ncbi:MAG TPA: hypothetical protein VE262_22210 [Blastocatellia bacterium]|nr:hypothetical protein [Blastocatellia bacterium]
MDYSLVNVITLTLFSVFINLLARWREDCKEHFNRQPVVAPARPALAPEADLVGFVYKDGMGG